MPGDTDYTPTPRALDEPTRPTVKDAPAESALWQGATIALGDAQRQLRELRAQLLESERVIYELERAGDRLAAAVEHSYREREAAVAWRSARSPDGFRVARTSTRRAIEASRTPR